VVVAKLASYREIEEWWSLSDLLDAHEVLDEIEKVKRNQIDKQKRRDKRK